MTANQICAFICAEPLKRELYLAALTYVSNPIKNADDEAQGAFRFDIETEIENQIQYETFYQPSGSLIDALVACGALVEHTPDPVYDPDTEEEFVDMSLATYELTEDGAEALENMQPQTRLKLLFAAEEQRQPGLVKLLKFCEGTPRSRAEIDELLNEICSAEKNTRHVAAKAIYPSYYVDCLQKAGALVWKDGWTTTKEGIAFLEGFSISKTDR